MAKSSKNIKTRDKELKMGSQALYLSAVILIIFLVYFTSLHRTWQPYDENLMYKEELLPIPTSFNEIFEIINSFVFNYHMLSMNSFFSNYVTLRSNQLSSILIVIVSFFFKKNAFLYHLLQLSIHIINSTLVFLIFKKSAIIFNKKKLLSNFEYLLISISTLIFALHSANTEAVLLVTNWTALLTYTFCFCFLLYEISKIEKNNFNISIFHIISVTVLFCLLMFFTEYAYTLPFILFFITLSFAIKASYTTNQALVVSLKKISPYLLGGFFYALFALANSSSTLNNILKNQEVKFSFYIFLERNLWLSPQIFLNFLKLLFFSKTLSAYQSDLINLANNLFEPFSIFSTLLYIVFLTLPLILFFFLKDKKIRFILPLIYVFFFSIFPFLHIITPTYCLIADRYCYFPSFALVFFILNVLLYLKQKKSNLLIACLSCILLILAARTFIRIQDWNNPVSFYNSAIKAEKKPLYKGHKLLLLADFFENQKMKPQIQDTIQESLSEFNTAITTLESLKEKYRNQPLTLRLYGIDCNSLMLKAAYGISIIKKNYFKEPINDIVQFFEPYIYKMLDKAAPNEIAFYGDILLKNNEIEKAASIYENAYKRFPFILEISLPLSDLYLTHYKNPKKAFQILRESYKYYPNKGMPMYKLLKYYEATNDLENTARFAYLLGLREHSIESYQHAAQIYLDLNKSQKAKKVLDKLIQLNPNNPLTLLQLTQYLDMTGNKKNVLAILEKAYLLNKASNTNETYITKAVLVSLVNINYRLGNLEDTRKYLYELENMKDLSLEDKMKIKLVKEKL